MLIRVEQLARIYQMGSTTVRALAGVDLCIEEGEFVSITGASGSGKSTFMHLLGCLDRPTSGSYELNGQLVTRLSDRKLAGIRNRQFGFVFQTFNLINRTSALDNVSVPLIYGRVRRMKKKAMAALERVGLADRSRHTPGEMSGGERQRVAIARAIVNDPSVVFADEPTGNLDSGTGAQILELFHRLNESGKTIILVTHEMSVAAQARRLIHMRDGLIDVDKPITDQLRRELLQSAFLGGMLRSDGALTPAGT
ncbi:MAG: ABC transporter ATP-binding protein [Phycisphaerae bacterium]